jgi:hypothetical protein
VPRDPFKKDYKPPTKAQRHTPTHCKLDVCAYHEGPVNPGADAILCSHPHKPLHMDQPTCPLYRLDWQKQLRQNNKPK